MAAGTADSDSGSESVSSGGKKRYLSQKRKYTKKPKTPLHDSSSSLKPLPNKRNHHRKVEVIEIDSSSEEEPDHDDARLDLANLPSTLNQRGDNLSQRAESLRQFSEAAALSSAGAPAQYHPHPALTQFRGGIHPLLGDPTALNMSRLGRVPSTIPTNMLLGTPPNLGSMQHSAAGLSHQGAPGIMVPATAGSQQLYFDALGAGSLRPTNGFTDPRFAAQYDGYLHRQLDGRGE
jgi:hypothetical protein